MNSVPGDGFAGAARGFIPKRTETDFERCAPDAGGVGGGAEMHGAVPRVVGVGGAGQRLVLAVTFTLLKIARHESCARKLRQLCAQPWPFLAISWAELKRTLGTLPVSGRTPWNSGFFYGVRSVRNAGVGRGGSERGNGGAGLGQDALELGLFYSCAKCAGCGRWAWGFGEGKRRGRSRPGGRGIRPFL